jgi:phage gp46-like protein
MATTHKYIRQSGGLGPDGNAVFTTVWQALAASASGTSGDYSFIQFLDSATYTENVVVPGTLQYLRFTAAAACSPMIASSNTPMALASGAAHIEVVGADTAYPITLHCTAGTSQTILTAVNAFRCQYVHFSNGGGGYAVSPPVSDVWTLEDCTFAGAMTNLFRSTTCAGAGLLRCDFSGATWADGLIRVNSLGLVMDRCWVEHAYFLLAAYGGVPTVATSKWLITNNVFIDSGNAPDAANYLPLFADSANAEVWGNLFYVATAGTTSALGCGAAVANVSIRNNGIVGFYVGIKASSPITVYGNGFWGCTTQAQANVTKSACVSTDPLLTNAAAHNFRPLLGSPWLDAGATVTLTYDYLGNPRPMGAGQDIGAFEMDYAPPFLASAGATTQTSVAAVFSEAVFGAALLNVLAWHLVPTGAPDVAIASIVCADGIHATVTIPDLVLLGSGLRYRLTCPASLVDSSGNPIAGTWADFTGPVWPETEPWSPPCPRATLDGVLLATFGLLPEPGEPPEAVVLRAAWLSLLCHRRAGPDDTLPDDQGDPPYRGGWWGDTYPTVPGDLWGSLWWLLSRTRDPDAAARAIESGQEALAWMVTDGLLTADPTVTATRSANGERLDVTIRLYINGHVADLVFGLWGGA